MPVEGVSAVISGLEGWVKGTQDNVVKAAFEIAMLLEAYAKDHHPWQDRTGDTRQSIQGTVAEISDEMVLILLSAGMNYDVFLELARGGKWAWLWPAVIANQRKILGILRRNLGSGQYSARQIIAPLDTAGVGD